MSSTAFAHLPHPGPATEERVAEVLAAPGFGKYFTDNMVLVDYDVTSAEVALMIAPMFHVASLGMGALPTLLKGGTLVLQDRFEPAAVLAAADVAVTMSMAVSRVQSGACTVLAQMSATTTIWFMDASLPVPHVAAGSRGR